MLMSRWKRNRHNVLIISKILRISNRCFNKKKPLCCDLMARCGFLTDFFSVVFNVFFRFFVNLNSSLLIDFWPNSHRSMVSTSSIGAKEKNLRFVLKSPRDYTRTEHPHLRAHHQEAISCIEFQLKTKSTCCHSPSAMVFSWFSNQHSTGKLAHWMPF